MGSDQLNGHGHVRATKFSQVNLKGQPVNTSKTGAWKATPWLYAIVISDAEVLIFALVLATYLITDMHQAPSKAATITINYLGTSYLLALLGGFIADSYLGSYWTIAAGAVISTLGYAVVIISTNYPGLQPAKCTPGPTVTCAPAGSKYMAPLYVGLYTLAVGGGLVKPNVISLGADQFDDSIPKEKEQGTHFFLYFFFCLHVGILLAITFGVYLVFNASPGWGFGFSFLVYFIGEALFFLGTPKYRHRPPTGSFLTRLAQVLVAALRKWRVKSGDLYDPPIPPGSMFEKLDRTSNLRFLNNAAVIAGAEDKAVASRGSTSWRLSSVSQVEETKRIVQVLPIWLTLFGVAIAYSQLISFTIQAASTLDRRLGSHFVIPASSTPGVLTITALTIVPIYDKLIVPVVRKFNNNPFGFTPLQRLGTAILFAAITTSTFALIEIKRLSYVRDLGYQKLPLGSYVLPMTWWWLVFTYVPNGVVEFNFWVSAYEFFYQEVSAETRSIGSSLTYSAYSMGYFLSTALVNLTNRITRHQKGGSWLEGQLNDGGLEKFFWLLSILLFANFLIFLVVTYFYKYKFDWYHVPREVEGPTVKASDDVPTTTDTY